MNYYSILSERNGAANYHSFNSLLDVAHVAGQNGFVRIGIGYTRVDAARNLICREFCKMSENDNDALIMMDADHLYPSDILIALTDIQPDLGVIAAVAHRRGAPYEPMFYYRKEDGILHAPAAGFEYGPLYQCQAVATSCIMIRRWVFRELEEKQFAYPWFRYEYTGGDVDPSEDMYFSKLCEKAKIDVYCHTGVEIPHATVGWIGKENYSEVHNDNN